MLFPIKALAPVKPPAAPGQRTPHRRSAGVPPAFRRRSSAVPQPFRSHSEAGPHAIRTRSAPVPHQCRVPHPFGPLWWFCRHDIPGPRRSFGFSVITFVPRYLHGPNGVVVFRPTTRSRPRLGLVVRCGDLTLQRNNMPFRTFFHVQPNFKMAPFRLISNV